MSATLCLLFSMVDQVDNSQRSPIFLQWIDCVWQILSQNAEAFEFGESLLLRLYEVALRASISLCCANLGEEL